MIHLAAETSALDVAWAAFDRAMLELREMYAPAAETPAGDRRAKANEVAAAWVRFRDLYVGQPSGPRPAV